MKTILTSVDHYFFDLSGVWLLLIVNDNLWQCCKWLFAWYLFDLLTWFEWKILLCLRVYEIYWVWHSWLSILSYWLRLVGWGISCLTVKYSLTMMEVGCGVIELSAFGQSLVDRMWSLLVSQMCLLLDELGQVRRVGCLLENLIRLTKELEEISTLIGPPKEN